MPKRVVIAEDEAIIRLDLREMLEEEGYAVVAYPGVAKPVEHFPEGLIEAMIPNDFEFAANNRARILKEWQSRYDGKSDPK